MGNLREFINVTRKSLDSRAQWLGGGTLLLGMSTSALGIASPLFMQHTINSAANQVWPSAYYGVFFIVLCISIEKLLQALSGIGVAMFVQHMNFNLGRLYVRLLIDVPMKQYIDRSPQEVVEILQAARNGNQVILQSVTGTIFPILIRFIAACCVLIVSKDFVIVLLVAVYTIVYGLFTTRITTQLTDLFSQAIDSSMLASRFLGDTAANVIVIKIFSAWTSIREKYNTEQGRLLGKWKNYFTKSLKLDFFRAASFFALLAACLFKSLLDVKNGTSSIGHFVLVNAYVVQICGPVDIMLKTASGAIEALAGFSPFFKFIRTVPNTVPQTAQPLVRQSTSTSIEFDDVSFSYGEQKPILNHVSFTINGGRTLALTGPTGAGKSTIVKLLLGLESPKSGRILINGSDIASYSEGELYSTITLVPQETYIFNDTLAFNLRVGKADASDEDLDKVLEAVQLTELIERLPEGLYSPVGDRGLLLSGGERQRIAIARALLRGAQILVVDEGTSALDEMTEADVLQAMRPTCQSRIVITVAHRATAIAAADEVRLVQNGEASLVRQTPEKVSVN